MERFAVGSLDSKVHPVLQTRGPFFTNHSFKEIFLFEIIECTNYFMRQKHIMHPSFVDQLTLGILIGHIKWKP